MSRFLHIARCTALYLSVAGVQAQSASKNTAEEADRLFRAASAAYGAGRLAEAESGFRRLIRLVPTIATAHAALGTVLLQKGDDAGAAAEFGVAHRLAPADAHNTLDLALAEQAGGANLEAANHFREAIASGASLTENEQLQYGMLLAATDHLPEAQRVLETATANPAPSTALLDALGTVLARQGQLASAEQRLEQALTADPEFAPAHAHLGSVLLAMNQPAPAASEFSKAVQLGDASTATASQQGRALISLGHPDDATRSLESTVKLHPEALDAVYTLALARQAAGEVAAALPLFQRAAAGMPDNPEVLTNYGLALVQVGNAPAGLQQYERALRKGDSALLRENMGVAYVQENNVDGALEQFRAGLRLAPDDVQLHYNLGLALKLKDDVPGATAELERAVALDPQLPNPHYTLGVLNMQQGDFKAAAEQLERATALQPNNGDAWALLGSVERQAGNNDQAAEALRHAIAVEPAEPGPHVTLAAILAERGDRGGAAAERKVAAELSRSAVNQQRGELALRSGLALLAQGKAVEAIGQLQTAVTALPKSAEAHRALADALQRTGRSAEADVERKSAALLVPAQP